MPELPNPGIIRLVFDRVLLKDILRDCNKSNSKL
jgi:hypothetical protein